MKFFLFSISLFIGSTLHAVTKSKDCSISGELNHWEIDYCLVQLETDDYSGRMADVDKCIDKLKKSKSYPKAECAKKKFLKEKHCNWLKKYKKEMKVQDCLKSNESNPAIVVNGGVSE